MSHHQEDWIWGSGRRDQVEQHALPARLHAGPQAGAAGLRTAVGPAAGHPFSDKHDHGWKPEGMGSGNTGGTWSSHAIFLSLGFLI